MRRDFGDRLEMSADRVRAHLLRNVDGIRFDLAIGMARAHGEPEPTVERNDDPLDLAGAVGAEYLDMLRLREETSGDAEKERETLWHLDAEILHLGTPRERAVYSCP